VASQRKSILSHVELLISSGPTAAQSYTSPSRNKTYMQQGTFCFHFLRAHFGFARFPGSPGGAPIFSPSSTVPTDRAEPCCTRVQNCRRDSRSRQDLFVWKGLASLEQSCLHLVDAATPQSSTQYPGLVTRYVLAFTGRLSSRKQ
jgi:hypothetical protein